MVCPVVRARRRSRFSGAIATGALGASLLLAPRVHAHGAATEPMPAAAIPPSPTPEGAAAQRILADLDAKARGAEAKAIAEPVQKARQALDRARGARASGDVRHGRLLDALALEWAETARELQRAAGVEQRAMIASRKASETVTQSERARTLLEVTQARRQRAAVELERLEAEARDAKKGSAEPPRDGGKTPAKHEPAAAPKKSEAPAPAPSTEPASGKKGSPR